MNRRAVISALSLAPFACATRLPADRTQDLRKERLDWPAHPYPPSLRKPFGNILPILVHLQIVYNDPMSFAFVPSQRGEDVFYFCSESGHERYPSL